MPSGSLLGEQEPLGPLSSWLPSIMVTLDICCAGQEWRRLTLGRCTYQCCRGTGKSNHFPPEPRSSQTLSSSSQACALPSVSLTMLPSPQAAHHACSPLPFCCPSPFFSTPYPQGRGDARLFCHTHLLGASWPCGHGQITSFRLSLEFPPRRNQAFARMKSDQVYDDDANNNCYLSGTWQV